MASALPLTRRHSLALTAGAALPAWGQDSTLPPVLRCYPAGPIYDYRWRLLNLALARGVEGLPPGLEMVDGGAYSQARALRELEQGQLDVLAFGTNTEREQRLRPVRIDILRGLVGMRLLLIRRRNLARLARMDPGAMRRELRLGLNADWADLPILRANGFRVVTAKGYDNLFAMLAAGRFDAFPRGVNEAEVELERFGARFPDLMIEPTKALYFSFPIFFWVHPQRVELAERIEAGLQAALADGRFKALFDSHHEREIRSMAQHPREVVLLRSDALPPGYVEPDTSWWWPRRLPTSR